MEDMEKDLQYWLGITGLDKVLNNKVRNTFKTGAVKVRFCP